jgi:hypothetical protein
MLPSPSYVPVCLLFTSYAFRSPRVVSFAALRARYLSGIIQRAARKDTVYPSGPLTGHLPIRVHRRPGVLIITELRQTTCRHQTWVIVQFSNGVKAAPPGCDTGNPGKCYGDFIDGSEVLMSCEEPPVDRFYRLIRWSAILVTWHDLRADSSAPVPLLPYPL